MAFKVGVLQKLCLYDATRHAKLPINPTKNQFEGLPTFVLHNLLTVCEADRNLSF